MTLAIDCRMLGSGGIGSYLAALLPFFVKEYEQKRPFPNNLGYRE